MPWKIKLQIILTEHQHEPNIGGEVSVTYYEATDESAVQVPEAAGDLVDELPGYDMPEEGTARLTVFDGSGKIVFRELL